MARCDATISRDRCRWRLLASSFHSLLSKATAGQVISTPGYGPLRPVKGEATGLELLQKIMTPRLRRGINGNLTAPRRREIFRCTMRVVRRI
ncbi:DUF839 domain-containing protein [Hyphomicrobium sp. 1Nfss2.1]